MLILKATMLAVAILSGANAEVPSPEPVAGKATLAISVSELEAVAVGVSAKKMILGKPIYNGVDKNAVGVVSDVIITPDKSISYAIVDVGGFLGIGRKHVAIPAGLFKMESGKVVLSNASKDTLKALPEFHYTR